MKSETKDGYIKLTTKICGEELEHRGLWVEANGPIPKGMQIHHINGIKSDNRLENLKLVTRHENMRESDRWGLGFYKSLQHRNYKRPYISMRRMADGVRKYLGTYGSPGGAFVAYRMAYVNT